MASFRAVMNSGRSFLPRTYCRWALYRKRCSSAVAITSDVAVTSDVTNTDTEQEACRSRPTGWSPPTGMPAPPGVTPDIPFRVRRSRYHQLPVYSDYKNGRSRILTKISKIDGDIIKMEAMLREYLQVENLRCKVDGVIGSIVLHGDHRLEVRRWLKSLGF